jgi:hypothetical protein
VARPFGAVALAFTLAVAGLVAFPSRSASAPPTSSVQLNLRNNRWDAVKVEVRVGTAASCDLNTDAWVRTLRKGQAWGVVASTPVCWRSEATPGSASTTTVWTSWQQPAIADGASVDADL